MKRGPRLDTCNALENVFSSGILSLFQGGNISPLCSSEATRSIGAGSPDLSTLRMRNRDVFPFRM